MKAKENINLKSQKICIYMQHFQFEVFGNLRNKIYFNRELIRKILVKLYLQINFIDE